MPERNEKVKPAEVVLLRLEGDEAERDRLRQQVEKLISYIDQHQEAGDCIDHLLSERVDQVRKELEA